MISARAIKALQLHTSRANRSTPPAEALARKVFANIHAGSWVSGWRETLMGSVIEYSDLQGRCQR